MTRYTPAPPFVLTSKTYSDRHSFGVKIEARWKHLPHSDGPAMVITIPFTHEEMKGYTEEAGDFDWVLLNAQIIDTLLDNPGQFYIEAYRAMRDLFDIEYPARYKEIEDQIPF